MTEDEIGFQLALWNAVHEWSVGTMAEKIGAVAKVNKLIDARSKGEFDRFQAEVSAWQRKTFPESTKKTVLVHMKREVKELGEKRGKLHAEAAELADILHLLVAYADKIGVSLMDETRKKFKINQNRKWGVPDAEGVREHVRDEEAT